MEEMMENKVNDICQTYEHESVNVNDSLIATFVYNGRKIYLFPIYMNDKRYIEEFYLEDGNYKINEHKIFPRMEYEFPRNDFELDKYDTLKDIVNRCWILI